MARWKRSASSGSRIGRRLALDGLRERLFAVAKEPLAAPSPRSSSTATAAPWLMVKCRGKDAGTEHVRAGMAWVYYRNARWDETLPSLLDAARAACTGLWADPVPVAP